MPNYCECELRITGKDIDAVLDAIAGEDEVGEGDARRKEPTAFDFNKVVPMPRSLDIQSGTLTDLALLCFKNEGLGEFAIYDWVTNAGYTTPKELCDHFGQNYDAMVALGHQVADNIEKHGAPDWYDWRRKNWGTKWNTTGAEVLRGDKGATILFRTAWAPPIPVVRRLSEMFPGHRFTLRYWEGGAGFKGVLKAVAGKGDDVCTEYKGQRGG